MEAVPRLPMICRDLKVSPSNTEFGPILKRYIRDHFHEDPESYSKEIKELETLRQNAIKAPTDFTGCSILKKYYSQLQKLQSRFPMTDDGAACVPFMWTDIYSGVAYNITDIEYEEACILYNIGALHSLLGTMDSRINAEGIKIACTHFQCAAWAFQHLRDTYPQPKGSDMSHDLLTFFINVMLAQAQECILEKSMLDNRKSSITAKIAAQVVDYYKCALGIMVSGSPSTDTGSILDIVGSKIYKGWKRFIEFKMAYYMSISHLYMGNQAEENEKWGERVAWYQSAFDHLTEAFKVAKKIGREDINEALAFTNDVVATKHSSSKKENDFVYHDKVPALSSLPELKGASLVKGIPFNSSDPDVSGPDIFARLVPMEAHETSSLYSEEKAKILRTVVSKIEAKNEELMAYLSTLQLENALSFDDEDKVPQELLEKCAALSVRPTAITDLTNLMNELLEVSKDVETSLKTSVVLLTEEEQKELKHQETFGKRGPSMITVELKKECSKYEEAHKKAIESNNTLQTAVNIHLDNLKKLSSSLDQIVESLPSACSIKTPENVKIMDEFNHLVNKVDEMRKQRHFLENQLRDALIKDDITKRLVTLDKKEDKQQTFAEELKKHNEVLTYIDQNLTAQDNILCALTEANARYADTRIALQEIRMKREETVKTLVNSFDAYEDLMEKTKAGLDFYKKLQTNVTRLLTRIKSVTKVQDEERTQRAEAELNKGSRISGIPHMPQEQQVPKLRDYLPYMNKHGGVGVAAGAAVPINVYPSLQSNLPPSHASLVPEPMRRATLGGPASVEFDRNLKPSAAKNLRPEDKVDISSMGIRPAPVGSEQTLVPAMCTISLTNTGHMSQFNNTEQPWLNSASFSNTLYSSSQVPYQYSTNNQMQQPITSSSGYPPQYPYASSSSTLPKDPSSSVHQTLNPALSTSNPNFYPCQSFGYTSPQMTNSTAPNAIYSSVIPPPAHSSFGNIPQMSYQISNVPGGQSLFPSSSPLPVDAQVSCRSNAVQDSTSSPGPTTSLDSVHPSNTLPYGPGQLPTSAVYPNSASPQSSVNLNALPATPSASPVLHGSLSPNMPSSGTVHTVNYPAATYGAVGDKSSFIPSGIASNIPNTVSANSYYMPYSDSQISIGDTALVSKPDLPPNNIPQNQTFSTWQSSVYSTPYSSAASNSISVINSMQYYQGPGAPVQAKQACVTASMDTKTNTLNSLNPYAVANSNFGPYSDQNLYSYMAASNFKTISSVATPGTIQTGSTVVPQSSFYPASVTCIHSTVPSCSFVGDLSTYSQSNYHTYTSSTFPNVANISNPLVASTIQSFPNMQSSVPMSNTINIQSNYMNLNQQNCQSVVSTTNSLSSISSAYESSVNIPNQQLQAPMEPQPIVPSQPLQPSISSGQINEINGSTAVSNLIPKSLSTDFHINAKRDFITPPPDSIVSSSKTHKTKETTVEVAQVLQPKVIDLKAIAELKEKDAGHLAKDPLDDPSVCSKFVSEVEKYEKYVDSLVKKSLNGTTPLDQKWKELNDVQDKESRKMSISVARCYPLKNRFPDVMPYDSNRVKLVSAKDDYINASYLKDICPNCPVFVVSQAPLPSTFSDFWLMVWEQQVETLICLLSDTELKNHVYFPKERGQVLTYGAYEISLHSHKEKNGFVERMINVTYTKNRTSRVVVHLQFTEWPVNGVPSSPSPLLQFVTDTISYYKQQRNLMRPIVVHCSAGIGRSGCFCLITAMVLEMNNGHGPRDVTQVAASISDQRKFLIQDKDQLKFCYDTLLYYAQDLLMRRGILTTRASFEVKLPGTTNTSSHVRHPSEDFILGGGLAKLQSGIAKLGLSSDASETVAKAAVLESGSKVTVTETEIKNESESGTYVTVSETRTRVQETLAKELPMCVGNGDIKLDSSASEQKNKLEITKSDEVDKTVHAKTSTDKHISSITSLLDPSNFTLDASDSPAKRKITKENFATSKGSLSTSSSDSADPLSQLDPLWSLKK